MKIKIGKEIKVRREALGWSQTELAKRIGTSQSTIDRIENGKSIRSRFLYEAAAAVGLDITPKPFARPQGAFDGEEAAPLVVSGALLEKTVPPAVDELVFQNVINDSLTRNEVKAILEGILSRWIGEEKVVQAAAEMLTVTAENQLIDTQTGNRLGNIRKSALTSILLYIPQGSK